MNVQADRVHIQRLRALDLWPGPTEFEPLCGGITNHNFLVRSAGRRFVARLCVERELLGIERRNEVICQREAHSLGVAPRVVHHESGVLVSEYVDARTLSAKDLYDPGALRRVAVSLRTLHDGFESLTGEMLYLSPFQTVRTYARTARELGARLPEGLDALVEDSNRQGRKLAPYRPVLCHNDLLPANILDDGERVWLVDWEYAGIGHPIFDLANLSSNARLTPDLEFLLLAAYHGENEIDQAGLRDFRILKAISLLREAFWALIQTVASDIDFDYEAYARENFESYLAERAKLEADD